MEVLESKHKIIAHLKYDIRNRFIAVFTRKSKDGVKNNFRCINCGKILFQYSGDVISIFDGAAVSQGDDIDILCGRCKLIYRVF